MNPPKIDSYKFGQIVIDGQSYTSDVIILPDRVIAGWWRIEGHSLHTQDLQAVFEVSPEVLVIGQGAVSRMRVPDSTCQALKAAGIEVIAQPTKEAIESYNSLRQQRTVAAALHLTC
jgi:hypothetical protein